jgi:hypothetical protein
VLLWTGTLRVSPVALQGGAIYVVVGLAAACFVYLLLFAGLTTAERRGVVVLLVLVLASSAFWAGYEQAGSALNLFTERHTDRLVGDFLIPTGWFQSVPSVFVILLAPFMAWLWVALEARRRDLSIITKFSIGLFGMALGFLVMAGAARVAGASGSAGPMWLVLTYLLHTIGELALSPVGMSATTRLAPRRFSGQAMGVWFTSIAMGNLLASRRRLARWRRGRRHTHVLPRHVLVRHRRRAGPAADAALAEALGRPAAMNDPGQRRLLVLSLATVYLVWGTSYMATRVGVLALPLLFGGVRFCIGGILLLAVAFWRGFSPLQLVGSGATSW